MSPVTVGHGSVIAGRYRLTDLLSDHDGAKFWRAEDRVLSRDVAVHVLPLSDPRASDMLDASRLAAVVHDPRLLRVLDADTVDDEYAFAVHEWGQGRSVDLLLADGPLSPRRAAWLVKEVAECLASCHVQGIAHGRLLPENVLINETGGVKLIGFVVDSSLHPGVIIWPLTDQDLQEHEADMVNLASLLYACLTGRWPGTEGSDVDEAPGEGGRVLRPRQVRAGVPRPLDRICSEVLSDPSSITLTAHDIASRLADYVGDPAPTEPTLLRDPAEREAYAFTPTAGPADRRGATTDGDARAGSTGAVTSGSHNEDTAVGAPVFFDDDTAVGWSEGQAAPPSLPDTAGGSTDARGPATDADPPRTPVDGVRPLFVDDAPRPGWSPGRRADEDTGMRHPDDSSVSTSSGSLWPLIDGGSDAGHDTGRDSGRGWMRLAVALTVLVVMVVAVLLAFNLGQRSSLDRLSPVDDASPDPSAETSAPSAQQNDDAELPALWPVRRVVDFDPQGDGSENPEVAADAADGNADTSWRTLRYQNNPELGGLKDGVGLVFDLGRQRPVGSVKVLLRGAPSSVQILAAPGRGRLPDTREDLALVGRDENVGDGRTTIQVGDGTTTRYVALWFTSLPEVAPARYQVLVSEVAIRP